MKVNTIFEILEARDERSRTQKKLIRFYKKTLICFTLNIAGNVKRKPLYDFIFNEGLNQINVKLKDRIIFEDIIKKNTGCEAYIVVDDDTNNIKREMVLLENKSSVSRLFDIDVISQDFIPLSRVKIGEAPRRCIICNKTYLDCRKNKSHSLIEIIEKTERIIKEEYAWVIANLAKFSLIAELSTTPKPGLVDLEDNGSHNDMDFGLFMCSINTIIPYLEAEYLVALNIISKKSLFVEMKKIGLKAEEAMLLSTKGINTHKGAFFSLSTIGCAICYLMNNNQIPTEEKIRSFSCEFSLWSQQHNNTQNSNGYKVRKNNKKAGIYHEAMFGYASVFTTCKQYLNVLVNKNLTQDDFINSSFDYNFFKNNIEDTSLRVLCTLLSSVEDSNIIHRGGTIALANMHNLFNKIIKQQPSIEDIKKLLKEQNIIFIKNNLSPGGTADLLAIVIFIMILKASNFVL